MINFRNIKQAADQLWDNGEIYTRPFHFGASHWDIKPSERDAKQLAAISDPTERRAAIEQLVHNSIDRLQRERASGMKGRIGGTITGAVLFGPVGGLAGYAWDKTRKPSKRILEKREKKYNELMKDRYPEDKLKYQAAVEAAVERLRGFPPKTAAENDLDPDVRFEHLPFSEQIKQEVNGVVRRAWSRRLIEAYKKATGKDLKDPDKQFDPKVGYVIGHGPNIKEKILKKLNPEDAYQMSGTWTSADNVTPMMIDDAVKTLRNDPRWNGLEKDKGKFRGYVGPTPTVTWE